MTPRNSGRILIAAAVYLLCNAAAARAFFGFDLAVLTKYPTAINLENCGTCHNDFSPQNSSLNPFGEDVHENLNDQFSNIDEALGNVENLDSDGDGTSNIDEIETNDGFFPGWTCETYVDAADAPTVLADLVDPIDPGCDGVTTTSTVTVTSTTLPGDAQCSQPVSDGELPVSTDCLYILNVAVGLAVCTPACICAPTGTLPAKATDALICLNVAVGIEVPFDCPCNGGTSTTVTSSTVTSTTGTSTSSSTEDSSTTTSTSSTTTSSSTTTTTSGLTK
jgi:hypothetical protein